MADTQINVDAQEPSTSVRASPVDSGEGVIAE
jgi:hypothetical protein